MTESLRFHGDQELADGLLDAAVNVRLAAPPGWLRTAVEAGLDDLGRYPDAAPARRAVAARHGRPEGEVLLTAGAAEAFVLLARALRPTRAVCLHPSFTEPEAALRAAGRPVERLVLDPPFRLDPAAVPADADLVVLGNPTNPTSVLHPAESVAALARPGRVLVVDEAFADFVPGEPASLAGRRDLPGLVVVRSLTKMWGLAGLRIGYLLAAPALVDELTAAQPPWPVSAPALRAAEACSTPAAVAEADQAAERLAEVRGEFAAALAELPGVEVGPDAAGPFLLLRVPAGDEVRLRLRERGVAVRRCDTFPGLSPDWLRIAVRADANGVVVDALAEALTPVHQFQGEQMTRATLQELRARIEPVDPAVAGQARQWQDRLTKPRGALGALEETSVALAALAGICPPPMPEPAAVAIFAADSGVHAQGVTPWPQEVTAQMVGNFLAGGAAVNAFATQVGARVLVVDVGVAVELETPELEPDGPRLRRRAVRRGTADFTTGPAMTREETTDAILAGAETAAELIAEGARCLLPGDMGIANTTPSAALIAVFTGADPAEVTGRGTGIDDATLTTKVDVVRRGLALHQPDPADPVGALAAVGGLEHAALVGFLLGAAAERIPVVLDGVTTGAAALVAAALAPEARHAWIAGHRSAEPGAAATLRTLGLRPLVDLELRLGEATGALLALPLVQCAARALREMATFDAAGVSEKG